MNKVIILGLAVISSVAIGCESSSKSETPAVEDTLKTEQAPVQDTLVNQEKSDTLTVSGVVSKIENGKDGYMATLKDAAGKEFVATISIINLQKSGGQFKRYKEGEKITVKGPSWKDESGVEHITVTNVE